MRLIPRLASVVRFFSRPTNTNCRRAVVFINSRNRRTWCRGTNPPLPVIIREHECPDVCPRTSVSHPLRVEALTVPGTAGVIGMTICPGKKGASLYGPPWERDLAIDLRAVSAWHQAFAGSASRSPIRKPRTRCYTACGKSTVRKSEGSSAIRESSAYWFPRISMVFHST